MCNNSSGTSKSRRPRLLLTTKSFECDAETNELPSQKDSLYTVAFIVVALFISEHVFRFALKDMHYLLEDELNVKKVARHLGVDLVGLSAVSYIGFSNRHICNELWNSFYKSFWNKKDENIYLHPSGFETRIFTYHPASQHLLLIFFAYQVKNLYDTIVFADGIEFVLHHIFSGIAAWGGMHPGYAHYYSLFFMGISEISTTILVMLSHFDPKFGVEGLPEAFPILKAITAVAFVISFIICRTILWPYVSYCFVQDAMAAIRSNSPMADGRRTILKFAIVSLSALSVLQVGWLFQIFVLAKVEIDKMQVS